MDLTKQPPRRPSNAGTAGIIGVARMADKASGHNDELIGEFKYGEDSGLDREVLEFISMSADEFAAAVGEMGDEALGALVLEKAQKSQAEIDAFNKEYLEREPQDELHVRLLKERLEKYAPERTDITTVFASIELDDWGDFKDLDLSVKPPRSPHLRTVAGIAGVARMGDKGRASVCGTKGAYVYGNDSGIDERLLGFLGIAEADFAQAAYENPNDTELGEWVMARCEKTPAEICAFNAFMCSLGRYNPVRERFVKRRAEICPECLGVDNWFDLIDIDDQLSCGLVDLTRRPPRSPFDVSVGGLTGLSRMIDKGRAALGDTLGTYWYGDDSGADKGVLEFLGVTADEFTAALGECKTDDEVVAWLGDRLEKPEGEVEGFNQKLQTYGPTDDQVIGYLRKQVDALDPSRTDICSWYGLMLLDDQITFARLKAGV